MIQYKSKISDEMDLKKRIQSLEDSIELHDSMKRQALAEFESYRQRVEDMQLCTEAQVMSCFTIIMENNQREWTQEGRKPTKIDNKDRKYYKIKQ